MVTMPGEGDQWEGWGWGSICSDKGNLVLGAVGIAMVVAWMRSDQQALARRFAGWLDVVGLRW